MQVQTPGEEGRLGPVLPKAAPSSIVPVPAAFARGLTRSLTSLSRTRGYGPHFTSGKGTQPQEAT